MCIAMLAALYINTAVSFKSNITKIYYCWPPIFSFLLFEKNICISDILGILVCDMVATPGTLIPFCLLGKIKRSVIKFNSFKEVRERTFHTNSLLHRYLFLMHVHE